MRPGRRRETLSGPSLFRLQSDKVVKLTPRPTQDERSLQRLFERHLRSLAEAIEESSDLLP